MRFTDSVGLAPKVGTYWVLIIAQGSRDPLEHTKGIDIQESFATRAKREMWLVGSPLRFAVSGLINVVLSYCVYLLLLNYFSYPVSYTVSYIAGIIISYLLHSKLVFKQPLSLGKALQYPLVYLVQYLLGLVLMFLLVQVVGLSQKLAPVFVLLVTVPVTYFLSRRVIAGKQQKRS